MRIYPIILTVLFFTSISYAEIYTITNLVENKWRNPVHIAFHDISEGGHCRARPSKKYRHQMERWECLSVHSRDFKRLGIFITIKERHGGAHTSSLCMCGVGLCGTPGNLIIDINSVEKDSHDHMEDVIFETVESRNNGNCTDIRLWIEAKEEANNN